MNEYQQELLSLIPIPLRSYLMTINVDDYIMLGFSLPDGSDFSIDWTGVGSVYMLSMTENGPILSFPSYTGSLIECLQAMANHVHMSIDPPFTMN